MTNKYSLDMLHKNVMNNLNEKENLLKDSKNSRITEIKLNDIKKKKMNYLLNSSNDLFNYFECKQNIEKDKNPKKTIDIFFNKKPEETKEADNKLNNSIKNYLKNNNFLNDNIDIYTYDSNKCEKCKIGEMIEVNHEGILLCNNCYVTKTYLVDNDKPSSYKEPPKEITFYAYKRINHFREILSQFQAKETTDINNNVIENIQKQIKKERIQLNELTNKKTKDILKRLGYNKYYEHIPFIKDKLGIKPPVMTPKLEETLCNLFMEIQIPYSKYCPCERVNFLNYYYTLYKLCELLDEKQYLSYFPMLKEQKKSEQDEIWKQICNELNWEFLPTL